MFKIEYHSPAKLNLMLHITGKRDDGYHNLQTAFQLIDLSDQIYFEHRSDTKMERIYGNEDIPPNQDLLIKAAHALQQQTTKKFGINIGINKKIPQGGGLGGGSSNAATVLLALNYHFNLGLTKQQLLLIAAQLGADVPIFVYAQTAWAEGIGERLQPLKMPENHFLVLHPQVFVSTKQLFASSELTRDCSPITIRAFLEGEGINVFESVVLKQYPEVKKAFDWLSQFAKTKLTGTGACLFAQFKNKQQAQAIQKQVPQQWSSWVTQGINQSPLHKLIEKI